MQTKLTFIILFLFITFNINANEKKQALYFGFASPSNKLTVNDLNEKNESILVGSNKTNYTFGYSRLPSILYSSYIRWSLEFSISPFKSDLHIVNRVTDNDVTFNSGAGKEVNLGTKISGFVSYINPTIDLYFAMNDDYYFYIGFGYGIGYANIHGNYYQTDTNVTANCKNSTTKATVIQNCSKIDASFSRIALSYNAILVLNLSSFAIKAEVGGPVVKYLNKFYTAYNQQASFIYQYRF